ncbi:unnamed protein product [Choristocarpus tenellus]
MDLTIHPGKIHLVHEILYGGVTGSVRVFGSLKRYDAATDEAFIEYKGETLTVGTSLIPGFQFRQNSLFEFIGEIEVGQSHLSLEKDDIPSLNIASFFLPVFVWSLGRILRPSSHAKLSPWTPEEAVNSYGITSFNSGWCHRKAA